MNNTERAVLQALVDTAKVAYFTNGHAATDEQAMGMLVSKFFHFDGLNILRVAYNALEDANFHSQAGQVEAMAAELTKVDDDVLIDSTTRSAVFASLHDRYGKLTREQRLLKISAFVGHRVTSLSDRYCDMTMGDARRFFDVINNL